MTLGTSRKARKGETSLKDLAKPSTALKDLVNPRKSAITNLVGQLKGKRLKGGAIIPPATTSIVGQAHTPPITAGLRTIQKPFVTVCENRHTIAPRSTFYTDGTNWICPICGASMSAY